MTDRMHRRQLLWYAFVVRAAIDQQYGTFGPSTPTPLPPG